MNSFFLISVCIAVKYANTNNILQAEVINDNTVCPTGSVMSAQIGMSDTIIRPVVVEPEGSPRDYTVSDFVCMTRPESSECETT